MRNSRNIEWLAEKLGVNSDEVDLFISAKPKAYRRAQKTQMKNPKCVLYYHPKLGRIYLGPNFIKIRGKIVADAGYESEEYIQKVQNTEKSEK